MNECVSDTLPGMKSLLGTSVPWTESHGFLFEGLEGKRAKVAQGFLIPMTT